MPDSTNTPTGQAATTSTPTGQAETATPDRIATPDRRWIRRVLLACLATVAVVAVVATAGPAVWMDVVSGAHRHTAAAAPYADVVVVFGAQLAPGGRRPLPYLAGRLATTAELVRAGRARVVLVSGDARGASGDEVTAMRAYLADLGVAGDRVVSDPDGLDTYDTCRRARDVYGVRRALLVTQPFHLPRAVALCRTLGIDAEGVEARCDGCTLHRRLTNTGREVAAGTKAVRDAATGRRPAVVSPPDPAIDRALSRWNRVRTGG